MGKKRWYRRGLQTQLLLVILCFTSYALAAQHVSSTAKKSKPGTAVKSAKPSSAKSARPSHHGKVEKTPAQVRTGAKKKSLSPTSPTKRASSGVKAHKASRLTKGGNLPVLRKDKRTTKNRRILVLRETKNRKLVRTTVTVPRSRMETRSLKSANALTPEHSTDILVSPSLSPSLPQEAAASPGPTTAAVRKFEPELQMAPQRPHLWSGYSPARARFTVTFNDEQLLYRLNSAFVLPGDEIFLEIAEKQKNQDYTFRTTLGKERQLGVNRWYWHAPAHPGVYPIKIQQTRSGETVTLNVFVLVPLERVEDGFLNGYRIGSYPTVALRQQAIYTPPRGFIEVTPEIENILISPHFRLQQFLCKQEGGYPKYLILDARLLVALELLLEKANARGYQARTFTIMSGYRTPYYNRAIGNSTTYSRHVWGDAADIFIDDNPPDGQMDDLNQDGNIDTHDAEVLYDLVESEYASRFQKLLVGGLARYRETSSHGPFVHVDVRGVEARWGARSPSKGFSSTIPVTLRRSGNSPLRQPSYWDSDTETDSVP